MCLHLDTPRFGTNTAGTQVWSWYSDAFGNGTPSSSRTVNLRMPGQYYDAESGLFYNWNRYYNPAIGRYISSDPIGLGGGLNTFSYAEASPVMYSDPLGLLNWVERKLVPQSVIDNAQRAINNICDNALTQEQVEDATNEILENISMSDALEFAGIDPFGKPVILTKRQNAIVLEQIEQIDDPVLKEAVKKYYKEAIQNGTVIVKDE